MTYFDELKRSMEWLAQKTDTHFIGQATGCAGTAISNTLRDIDQSKKLELPVFEDTQMGMTLGMSLEGIVPISIYPRLNFLMCAMSQLVNHIDKYSMLSNYKTKLIIRSSIGSKSPLDPQAQHKYDFSEAIKSMCHTIKVIRLDNAEDIFPAYVEAYEHNGPSLLIEWADFLNEDFRLAQTSLSEHEKKYALA